MRRPCDLSHYDVAGSLSGDDRLANARLSGSRQRIKCDCADALRVPGGHQVRSGAPGASTTSAWVSQPSSRYVAHRKQSMHDKFTPLPEASTSSPGPSVAAPAPSQTDTPTHAIGAGIIENGQALGGKAHLSGLGGVDIGG